MGMETAVEPTPEAPSPNPASAKKTPAKGILTPTDEKLGPWKKDPVNVRLRGIRWRQRLFNLLTLLLGVLATLLLYIVLMMCADRIGEFASSTRQLWLGTSSMMLAVTALLMSAYFLASKFNPMHHAREVDRALGFDDDSLVTYVDLRRRMKAGANEVGVAVLLQESALERVSRIDADQVVDARPLAVVLKILGGTAAVLLLLFLFWGRTFNDSFMRTVMPWRNVAAPRWTQITDIVPGNGMGVAGEPVRFACIVKASSTPDAVTLKFKMDGEARGVVETLNRVKTDANGAHFTSQLPGFARSVTYYIECGDAKAGPFRLEIAERPLIASVNVRVHPPTYATFAPIREVAGGHVQAVAGSRLEIVASSTHPPRVAPLVNGTLTAWIEAGGQRSAISIDGSTLTANVILTRDFEYRIGFVDTRGLTSRDGVQYQAKVVADRPPLALLAREDAAENTPAPHNGRIALRAEASDDLGLAKISLRLNILGGLDGAPLRTLEHAPLRPPREFKNVFDVKLEELNLREGDTLDCVLVAEDILRPKGQVTISPVVRIPIVRGESRTRQVQDALSKELAARAESADRNPRDKDAERSLERPSDTQLQKRDLEELSADEKRLMRELAELIQQKQDESTQGMRNLTADEMERLAEELAELAKDAQADASGKDPNAGEGTSIKTDKSSSGSESADKNSGDQKSGEGSKGAGKDAAGKDTPGGKESGSAGKEGKDGQNGQPGAKDSPGSQSGGKQGDESGKSGRDGNDKGSNGKAGGKGAGSGAGKNNSKGDGNGEGQSGQNPSSSGGDAGKGGDGKPGEGGQSSGGGAPNNAGSKGGSKSNSPGGGGKGDPKSDIEKAAQDLRDGNADKDTLDRTRAAFDHLFKNGRALSTLDREKLKAAAEGIGPDGKRRNNAVTPEKAGAGRVRKELLSGNGNESLTNKAGDMKEDELGRMIERGKAKIAPEYRKALEDYYKSLNK